MQYHVNGMDCASCVGKIESALSRMTGVSDVQLNFSTKKLSLTLDPDDKTTVKHIEKTIKSLGFDITEVSESPDGSSVDAYNSYEDQHWWQSKKGRQVIGLGVLMSAAYILSIVFPNYGSWVFALAVLIGVLPFARKAWALSRTGTPFSIEMLMSVAAIGALFIGEAEEAAAVVFLFSVGELFESVAADRARAGIKALTNLIPKNAILIDSEGKQHEVAASTLKVNDIILIRPGDRVSADGEITLGESNIDDSPITGESVPIHKTIADTVFAGSVNLDGVIEVKVEKTAKDNTIARIIDLVEQAQASKAPTARFIEKFSQYYTPIVMGIAALIIIIPPLFMAGDWMTWLYRGLALLLIACPCALVLSTPAAIASGLAVGARRGLLIKGGGALETIGQIDTLAFDKTGTLTEGEPKVTNIIGLAEPYLSTEGERELLGLFAGIEYGSSHPLAKSIVNHAETSKVTIPAASNSYATAGKAVHATINQRALAIASPVYATNETIVSASQQEQIETLQNEGKTVSVMFDEESCELLGLIALRDELREDSQPAIAELKSLGIRSVMLTGDNKLTAKALASDLQIDWEAELLPEDKLNLLGNMRSNNKIAMVGDGINDAPALATADVGIAMGGGTDVAMETADIALLKSRVMDVAHLIKLSRATMRNIRQNVVFALGLKGVFLITTILGVTGLWIAVLADAGATVLVTINALRLLNFKGSDE